MTKTENRVHGGKRLMASDLLWRLWNRFTIIQSYRSIPPFFILHSQGSQQHA